MRWLMPCWMLASWLLVSTSALAADLRLGVLEFVDASSDPGLSSLGKGLSSMVTTDLSNVPDTVLVERARLQEVFAELDLSRSDRVDPALAVRIGKIAGATHLVDGTYTVVDDTMRMDVRLIEVSSGEVVLGRSVQGERQAFFELQKELVRALVQAMGASLQPKQRAELGRVHTADFEAFREFSDGIALFDEGRYADAVAKLDEALVRDGEFRLATLTQQEWHQISKRLQVRVDALKVARLQRNKLDQTKEIADQVTILEFVESKLALDGEAHTRDRLTALYVLAHWYAQGKGPVGHLLQKGHLDQHASRRLGEHYWQRYHAEAWELWPAIPVHSEGVGYFHLDSLQADFEKRRSKLWRTDLSEEAGRNRRASDSQRCLSGDRTGEWLHLDLGERADLCEQMMARAAALGLPEYPTSNPHRSLARTLAEVGRYSDAARQVLLGLEGEDDERVVASRRAQIDQWRDFETALASSDRPDLVREYLLLIGSRTFYGAKAHVFAQEHLGQRTATSQGRYALAQLRHLRNLYSGGLSPKKYMIWGEHPLFLAMGSHNLTTGARPDWLRTPSLAYYTTPDRGRIRAEPYGGPTIALLDGLPSAEVELAFVQHDHPDELWWPRQISVPENAPANLTWRDLDIDAGTPRVAVLVGARDILVRRRHEPETREMVLARPFRAWAIVLGRKEISVARVVETQRSGSDRTLAFEPLSTTPRRGKPHESTEVRVAVTGSGEVTVTLDGRRHTLQIEGYEAGSYGLYVDGDGFVRFDVTRR
ncbi:MAG: CsgG/HfaB family protein [Myxococcales bacterium]|nr:CsgG/HfaB family protein [Myxococcales bacterium]